MTELDSQDPLQHRVSVEAAPGGVLVVAVGSGQRVAVSLDAESAVHLADELYELAEGPVHERVVAERELPEGLNPDEPIDTNPRARHIPGLGLVVEPPIVSTTLTPEQVQGMTPRGSVTATGAHTETP